MAKKISILICCFLVAIGAHAQFSVGIQGGSNFSSMDFTNNTAYRFTEVNSSQGLIGGLVAQFEGGKHTGLQLEVNYTQRGWIEKDTVGINDLKYRTRMDYIEVPFLTHINIGGGKLRGIFHIGPYIAYALNKSTEVTDQNTGSTESSEHTFNKEEDNRLDYGLLAGGGIEYRLSYGVITAEVRYTIGLGDINKVKTYQSEVSQFRVLGILLRYTLPIGRSD